MPRQVLLTEAEAAEALRLSARTLREARKAGELRYVLCGRAVRYTPGDLDAYVDLLKEKQAVCVQQDPEPRAARKRRCNVIPFHRRRSATGDGL